MGFRVLKLHPERDMWDQQPGETGRCYTQFLVYRDTPRHERSLSKVAESLTLKRQTIHEQAHAHAWKDRAAAWDVEQARKHHDRIACQADRPARAQIDMA